ncbi:hypothetical protein [Sulfitobacter pacificus]|uniref:hypothetical protein n=1 Tax=Sulfitobacter pacificus TaxID=1499314 RepID=UPI0031024AC5
MIHEYIENFKLLIESIQSGYLISTLALFGTITGTSLFAAIWKLALYIKENRRLGRSRHIYAQENKKLLVENAKLAQQIQDIEDIVSKENSDFSQFIDCMPASKEKAHALLHEIANLSEKAEKTNEHSISYDDPVPVSQRFMLNVTAFIASRWLLQDKDMYCARNVVSQKILDNAFDLTVGAAIKTASKNYSSIGSADEDLVLSRIDTVWKLCQDDPNFHTKDNLLAAKILLSQSKSFNSVERDQIGGEAFEKIDKIESSKPPDSTLPLLPNCTLLQFIFAGEADEFMKNHLGEIIFNGGKYINPNIAGMAKEVLALNI